MTLQEINDLGRKRYKIFGVYYKICLIYKLINLINGKIYIGLTTNLSKRFKSYLYHGQNGKGQQFIHKAIRKYGIKNFNFEVLETPFDFELSDREKFWIKQYKSDNKHIGYNLTNGGERFKFTSFIIDKMKKSANNKKRVFLYNQMGIFIREFDSVNSCGLFLKRKHCSILSAIKQKSLVSGIYLVSFEKHKIIDEYKDTKSIQLKKKLKNNRNCRTFFWKLIDSKTNRIYIEDGIRKLSLTSGYKDDILRCIAYNRIGYKKYKEFLKIEKLNEYDQSDYNSGQP